MPTAAEYAADLVASVRDDPAGRVALMRSLYEAEPGRPELHLPYRRAALGFMGWQLRRGLLNPLDARGARQSLVAGRQRAAAAGHGRGARPGAGPERPAVVLERHLLRGVRPAAVGPDVVPGAQREHRGRLPRPPRAGRVRDAPRALLPQPDPGPGPVRARPGRRTPAGAELAVARRPRAGRPAAHVHGHLRLALAGDARPVPVDQGPRVVHRQRARVRAGPRPGPGPATPDALYTWSAAELSIPELSSLVQDGVPTYAWDVTDVRPWNPATGSVARAARSVLPAPGRRPSAR